MVPAPAHAHGAGTFLHHRGGATSAAAAQRIRRQWQRTRRWTSFSKVINLPFALTSQLAGYPSCPDVGEKTGEELLVSSMRKLRTCGVAALNSVIVAAKAIDRHEIICLRAIDRH